MSYTRCSLSDLMKLKSRLQEKLKRQEKENDRLRQLAITQWANKIAEADDDEDKDDLSSALDPALSSRLMPKVSAATMSDFPSICLRKLTDPVMKWKCEGRCKTNIKQVTDDCQVVQSYDVIYIHESHLDAKLEMSFLTTSPEPNSKSHEVKNLVVRLEANDLVLANEIAPVVYYCERNIDFHVAFVALESYLAQSEARIDALSVDHEGVTVSASDDCVEVVFDGTGDNGRLAVFTWKLVFDESKFDFEECYNVAFTDRGKIEANECGFPADVANVGRCDYWTAKYCFENLCKMSDLDTTAERDISKSRREGDLEPKAKKRRGCPKK